MDTSDELVKTFIKDADREYKKTIYGKSNSPVSIGPLLQQLIVLSKIGISEYIIPAVIESILQYVELAMLSANAEQDVMRQRKRICKYFQAVPALINTAKFRNIFIEAASEKILDMFVYESCSSACKGALIKMYNFVAQESTKTVRCEFAEWHLDYLYKLVDCIATYGDYDVQSDIMETIFRLFGTEIRRGNATHDLVPGSGALDAAFRTDINVHNFDADVRRWLNEFNRNSDRIFSIACVQINYGEDVYEDSEQMWADFNMEENILSWYFTISSAPEQCSRISVESQYVTRVQVQRSLGSQTATISIEFKEMWRCDDGVTLRCLPNSSGAALALIVDSGGDKEKLSRLITSVLPAMYKKQFSHSSTRISISQKRIYKPLSIKQSRSCRSPFSDASSSAATSARLSSGSKEQKEISDKSGRKTASTDSEKTLIHISKPKPAENEPNLKVSNANYVACPKSVAFSSVGPSDLGPTTTSGSIGSLEDGSEYFQTARMARSESSDTLKKVSIGKKLEEMADEDDFETALEVQQVFNLEKVVDLEKVSCVARMVRSESSDVLKKVSIGKKIEEMADEDDFETALEVQQVFNSEEVVDLEKVSCVLRLGGIESPRVEIKATAEGDVAKVSKLGEQNPAAIAHRIVEIVTAIIEPPPKNLEKHQPAAQAVNKPEISRPIQQPSAALNEPESEDFEFLEKDFFIKSQQQQNSQGWDSDPASLHPVSTQELLDILKGHPENLDAPTDVEEILTGETVENEPVVKKTQAGEARGERKEDQDFAEEENVFDIPTQVSEIAPTTAQNKPFENAIGKEMTMVCLESEIKVVPSKNLNKRRLFADDRESGDEKMEKREKRHGEKIQKKAICNKNKGDSLSDTPTQVGEVALSGNWKIATVEDGLESGIRGVPSKTLNKRRLLTENFGSDNGKMEKQKKTRGKKIQKKQKTTKKGQAKRNKAKDVASVVPMETDQIAPSIDPAIDGDEPLERVFYENQMVVTSIESEIKGMRSKNAKRRLLTRDLESEEEKEDQRKNKEKENKDEHSQKNEADVRNQYSNNIFENIVSVVPMEADQIAPSIEAAIHGDEPLERVFYENEIVITSVESEIKGMRSKNAKRRLLTQDLVSKEEKEGQEKSNEKEKEGEKSQKNGTKAKNLYSNEVEEWRGIRGEKIAMEQSSSGEEIERLAKVSKPKRKKAKGKPLKKIPTPPALPRLQPSPPPLAEDDFFGTVDVSRAAATSSKRMRRLYDPDDPSHIETFSKTMQELGSLDSPSPVMRTEKVPYRANERPKRTAEKKTKRTRQHYPKIARRPAQRKTYFSFSFPRMDLRVLYQQCYDYCSSQAMREELVANSGAGTEDLVCRDASSSSSSEDEPLEAFKRSQDGLEWPELEIEGELQQAKRAKIRILQDVVVRGPRSPK